MAAADAPARPVPTTMILNLRLLFGLTSFASAMNLSHFSASGPSGTLASSVIVDRRASVGRAVTVIGVVSSMMPACTAIGNETLPTTMTVAMPAARPGATG